jgi:hypothetical protein
MKTFLTIIALIFLFIIGCDRDELPAPGDGLSMTIGDRVVLTAKDIDYYDLSTHFVYLKGDNSFLTDKLVRDSFQIYANNKEIYAGVFHSGYMSSMPIGPAIYAPNLFYGNYVVPITFVNHFDQTGKIVPRTDPRKDSRIIDALKSHNQLHVGLQCEIRSVQFSSLNQIKMELELINNDSFNYYYLDPEKMGLGLFHYFTSGLSFWSPTLQKMFENHVKHIQPEPYDSWQMNWLSVIGSHEKKSISINYTNFDPIPTGQYKLYFRFPGLGHVEKADLVQQNGRIWLGELDLSRDFQIR